MKNVLTFIKKEILLVVSGCLALLSMFFVPVDKEYIDYINLHVLTLLFCLMAVVAGFEATGLFDKLKMVLMGKIKGSKSMIFTLTMLCFFTSALITNDVALITFVPFSIAILKKESEKSIIFCVVMETIAANLGSLMTPIGNPQNLFLFTNYGLSIGEFFKITLPLSAICFIMICLSFLLIKKKALESENSIKDITLDKKKLIVYSVLFIFCILSVLSVVSPYITLILVVIGALSVDKKVLKKVDYILLLTFVFFFIFSGNIARIPVFYDFIALALSKNEVVVSALISQVISNVPAATMLSSFTDNAKALILGTNIGGLGTLIASMASLISFRFIAKEKNVSSSKYILTFTIFNLVMLLILLFIYK